MLKQIVKETVKILIDRPRIIRLALLTSYSYTFYQIYWIIYFINWLVNIKYNSWVDISNALIYFVNAIQRFNILRLIIVIAAIFILWISIFWPIWRQALLYSIDNPNMRTATAFLKWWKKWWIMAILDALIFKQSCNHNSFYHMDYMRTMKNHTLAICKLLYCFERLFSMGCCSKKYDLITI